MLWRVGVGVSTLALALGLVACSAANQAAASAASTPSSAQAAGQQTTTGSTANASAGPNVAGTVQSVNGSTITVQRPRGGGSVMVQLTGTTSIRKQVQGTIGDVKAGDPIVAIGQQNGSVLQARQIQLGATPGPARSRGGAGANGRAGASGTSFVDGTVDSVSGNTITVKTNSGSSVQVQLAANGRIVEQTSGTASDIRQGDFVVALGQLAGNTLTATSVNVSTGFPGGGNQSSGGSTS